jgi:hypothetical protein
MLMTHELRKFPTPLVKEPDTFDGSDPHQLNNFILLCHLYFRRNPAFSHGEAKVMFALSHLRGTALELFEPAFPIFSAPPDWLYDWSTFVRTLRDHFGPVDPTADAENDIDNLKMSENDRIINYNVKFNHLAALTGWDDSVLRHRYYSGLSERIKDIIGHQEKPSTLSAMKYLAHSIDSRHWERLRERSRSDMVISNSRNSNSTSQIISDSTSEIPDSESASSNSEDPKNSENSDIEDSDSEPEISAISDSENSENSAIEVSDSEPEISDPDFDDSDPEIEYSEPENSESDISDSGDIDSDSGSVDSD